MELWQAIAALAVAGFLVQWRLSKSPSVPPEAAPDEDDPWAAYEAFRQHLENKWKFGYKPTPAEIETLEAMYHTVINS